MAEYFAGGHLRFVDGEWRDDDGNMIEISTVRHGQWKCYGDCGVTECSVCGWSIEEYVGDYTYCPNCGAKMDGGNK